MRDALIICCACLISSIQGFVSLPKKGRSFMALRHVPLFLTSEPNSNSKSSATATSSSNGGGVVDANVYNVNVTTAAELWTVSVSPERQADRPAGVPYMDVTSKDYYVDDVQLTVSRSGGMGLELLELAGGRASDDYGITVVSAVSGNAEVAGVLAGDSIASVEVRTTTQATAIDVTKKEGLSMSATESVQVFPCECKNFDTTIGLLASFPPNVEELTLNMKRIRRWPKLTVVVEYPPIQCADGTDNKETIELFAGENLKRALQNRGIVLEDRNARKCDFCGGKCTVKVDQGMPLLSPMSTTEEKIMRRNPKCRLSCRTTVGHNMQEGFIRLKVNVNEWTAEDKQSSNPFFSR